MKGFGVASFLICLSMYAVRDCQCTTCNGTTNCQYNKQEFSNVDRFYPIPLLGGNTTTAKRQCVGSTYTVSSGCGSQYQFPCIVSSNRITNPSLATDQCGKCYYLQYFVDRTPLGSGCGSRGCGQLATGVYTYVDSKPGPAFDTFSPSVQWAGEGGANSLCPAHCKIPYDQLETEKPRCTGIAGSCINTVIGTPPGIVLDPVVAVEHPCFQPFNDTCPFCKNQICDFTTHSDPTKCSGDGECSSLCKKLKYTECSEHLHHDHQDSGNQAKMFHCINGKLGSIGCRIGRTDKKCAGCIQSALFALIATVAAIVF